MWKAIGDGFVSLFAFTAHARLRRASVLLLPQRVAQAEDMQLQHNVRFREKERAAKVRIFENPLPKSLSSIVDDAAGRGTYWIFLLERY